MKSQCDRARTDNCRLQLSSVVCRLPRACHGTDCQESQVQSAKNVNCCLFLRQSTTLYSREIRRDTSKFQLLGFNCLCQHSVPLCCDAYPRNANCNSRTPPPDRTPYRTDVHAPRHSRDATYIHVLLLSLHSYLAYLPARAVPRGTQHDSHSTAVISKHPAPAAHPIGDHP